MAIFPLRATAALLLLASAACEDLTVPDLGGAYLGQVDSPFTVEGAALLALPLTGLQSITTPNRVMFAQPMGDSLRVLIINRPDRAFGGPLSFVIQLDDGVPPQGGEVLAVSAPDNEIRDFTGGFILRFSRDRTEGGVVPVVPAPATPVGPVGPYTLEQLVAHFFGAPVSAEVQAYMDSFGNASGAYDIGDVRQYLVRFPGQIPTDRTTWTR
jgi:hypothetical protein